MVWVGAYLHFCLLVLFYVGAPPVPGIPGAPPPPGGFGIPQGPVMKEKKKYKLDVQMRRMNWNQVKDTVCRACCALSIVGWWDGPGWELALYTYCTCSSKFPLKICLPLIVAAPCAHEPCKINAALEK